MLRLSKSNLRSLLPAALAFVVLLTIPACPARPSSSETAAGFEPSNRTLSYLRLTIKSLQGAMDFFQRHYANVNLDAVIGTRIVEGTLKILLANLQRRRQSEALPNDVLSDIQELYHLSKLVSDQAEPHVAASEQRYYGRIWPTIHEGLWELDYPTRNLSTSVPMWSYEPKEYMSEVESDDCLTELFGTTGKTKRKCVISDTCWKRMTSLGYSLYSLSHEIFYLQIGEQSKCLPQIEWKILMSDRPGLHVLQHTFCANMLREAVSIARSDYPAPLQDLFMEQAALCGMYGFPEFFQYEWLDEVLSWQDKDTGCYRWAGWPQEVVGSRAHHITKREEKRLDNGCLCHRTTVAAGALVQYVRYLTETYLAKATLDNPRTDWTD